MVENVGLVTKTYEIYVCYTNILYFGIFFVCCVRYHRVIPRLFCRELLGRTRRSRGRRRGEIGWATVFEVRRE